MPSSQNQNTAPGSEVEDEAEVRAATASRRAAAIEAAAIEAAYILEAVRK